MASNGVVHGFWWTINTLVDKLRFINKQCIQHWPKLRLISLSRRLRLIVSIFMQTHSHTIIVQQLKLSCCGRKHKKLIARKFSRRRHSLGKIMVVNYCYSAGMFSLVVFSLLSSWSWPPPPAEFLYLICVSFLSVFIVKWSVTESLHILYFILMQVKTVKNPAKSNNILCVTKWSHW